MNMKVGICFGGYCPMHQGHLDVIMRAKKENDVWFAVFGEIYNFALGSAYGYHYH